jgi:hypothetical protein
MAVERYADTHVSEVCCGLDDLAAVIGCVAEPRHVAAVFVFHLVLLFSLATLQRSGACMAEAMDA